MGPLLRKDLRILRRSPVLVAGLVLYPVVVALLIGFALSRGPDKPRVAFLNLVAPGQGGFDLGGERIDASRYADQLFRVIDPVRVRTREQALAKVRDGDALAALIVPPDITQRLASGSGRPTVEVAYNAEDPVKARFVEATISARLAEANAVLSRRFTQEAGRYTRLLLTGGQLPVFGRSVDVLGLQRTRTILQGVQAGLAPRAPERLALDAVVRFATLAIDNLDLSTQLLGSISSPVGVKRTVVQGRRTPLDAFATAVALTVSIMFVCVLLAAGMLALEREEHTVGRLSRGLVRPAVLLAEKVAVAALCAGAVGLVMLVGIGLFIGVDLARLPVAALALAVAAVAFSALGVAIGSLAREVRAASLLAFLLTLPLAFLALVPSGAVAGGLYDAIRVVSALFPFKPALSAVDAGLNGPSSDGLVPLAHLAALTLAFGALARVGMRRLA